MITASQNRHFLWLTSRPSYCINVLIQRVNVVLIHITADGQPIFRQIVDQIRFRIVSGTLVPGDELPAIRTLAERLQVNPNTVARAYRELEQEGLVEKRRTRGTFVAQSDKRLNKAQRRKQIQPEIDRLLIVAYQLGVSTPELIELLQARDQSLQKDRPNE